MCFLPQPEETYVETNICVSGCQWGQEEIQEEIHFTSQPSPPIDDDIDYTDFQFDEPQEVCVSICDDIEPAGDRSTNPIIVKEEHAEEAPSCDGGQALPLSYLGLSHWTEALVQPRLDPQVTLVDLFQVRLQHLVISQDVHRWKLVHINRGKQVKIVCYCGPGHNE